jgi:hypothetical protein
MSSQPPVGEPPQDLDFVIPTPQVVHGRSSTVAAAAGALAIAGLFAVAGAALVAGTGGSATQIVLVGAFGVAQLATAVLVFRQVPVGRPVGIALAAIGVVFGLVRLIDGTGIALLDLVAYAFVVWALATSGDAFRRG